MIGFYRISLDGWVPKNVYTEARDLGLRWWYRGFKAQLLEYKKESR